MTVISETLVQCKAFKNQTFYIALYMALKMIKTQFLRDFGIYVSFSGEICSFGQTSHPPIWFRVVFNIECRKTKTKEIILANHRGHRQYKEPINTQSNYV